jgi:hypothetical protein
MEPKTVMNPKIIDLNKPYRALNGQPVLNQDQSIQTLGFHFGVTLSSIQQGDPFVLCEMAENFFNGVPVTVDDSKLNFLIQVATECPLPAILRKQLLTELKA